MRRDIGQYKKMQDDGEYVIDECQKLYGERRKSRIKVGDMVWEPLVSGCGIRIQISMDLNEREAAIRVRRYMRIPDVKKGWSAGVSE